MKDMRFAAPSESGHRMPLDENRSMILAKTGPGPFSPSILFPRSIANDVSIALRESRVLGRIQTGVHARENREVTRRWYRQFALGAERRRVARIRLQNFWPHAHRCPPCLPDGLWPT